MELNKENMRKIRWLIAFAVLLYLGIQNLAVVLKYVKLLWGLLLPFVLGGAMAFVLNVPMSFIERHLFGKVRESRESCFEACKTCKSGTFHCICDFADTDRGAGCSP